MREAAANLTLILIEKLCLSSADILKAVRAIIAHVWVLHAQMKAGLQQKLIQ